MQRVSPGAVLPMVERTDGGDWTADAPTLRVLSLGGGTQSCALALMSAAGDLPKLDAVVFADTQGELPETYDYIEYLRDVLDTARIPLHVVTAGNLERAILGEKLSVNPTPPVHIDKDGTKSRINGYKCSYDFKRRQIERKVKALCGKRGAWKDATIEQWIGFSEDEAGRCKEADGCKCGHTSKRHVLDGRACDKCRCQRFVRWATNRWPLIELGMKRGDTIAWFADHGHPTPPRSACWFCPNSGNDRWSLLRAEHPDLFERACVMDETIRHFRAFPNDGRSQLDDHPLYLHGSLVALRDADLRSARQIERDAGVLTLFDDDVLAGDCTAEACFT